MDKLKPLINAQTELADLNRRIGQSMNREETSASDEARSRESDGAEVRRRGQAFWG
jgi:hypothetical protein